MLKKIMPLFALLFGLAGGGAAAIFLAPPPDDEPMSQATAPDAQTETSQDVLQNGASDSFEIVKLPSQFVVPVIMDNRVRAMVILTVALEVEVGQGDRVRALEPKLRDEFLAELFGLAALDGFKDEMISRTTLELVKRALSVRSIEVLGLQNVNVLVTDMARQDVF
ncbi:MAG: flagellar basal body-associated protein FliL [Pelagibaca sp.]